MSSLLAIDSSLDSLTQNCVAEVVQRELPIVVGNFGSLPDLLALLNQEQWVDVEVIAESNPYCCGLIRQGTLRANHGALAQTLAKSIQNRLVLTGCNTGVQVEVPNIAQLCAQLTNKQTLGTMGYAMQASFLLGHSQIAATDIWAYGNDTYEYSATCVNVCLFPTGYQAF